MKNSKLPEHYYLCEDVIQIARDLLGKILFTRFGNKLTGGLITETEAYAGVTDRASHAFGDRRTERTAVMYQKGGTAYVYLCYGMHSLFNVVTNKVNIPHAVLIRCIIPYTGEQIMLQRTGKKIANKQFGNGPGKVSKALGIHYSHSGLSLTGKQIWIEDRGICPLPGEISSGPRIGVDYAGPDAALPYRFIYTKHQKK